MLEPTLDVNRSWWLTESIKSKGKRKKPDSAKSVEPLLMWPLIQFLSCFKIFVITWNIKIPLSKRRLISCM